MSDTSYYARKKKESDDKVQEALNARKERTAKEKTSQPSLAEKKKASDSKVEAALADRAQRVQSSLPSIFSEMEKLYNAEIDSYKGTKPTYGAYEDTIKSQRERRISISNLRNKVNAYRSYMDSSVADDILSTLDKMESGYNAYLGMSKYKSQEDYDTAVRQYGWQQEYQGMDYLKLRDEWAKLEPGSEKQEWLKSYAPSTLTGENIDASMAEVSREVGSLSKFIDKWDTLDVWVNDYMTNPGAASFDLTEEEVQERLATHKAIINRFGSYDKMRDTLKAKKEELWSLEKHKKYGLLSENDDFKAVSADVPDKPTEGLGFGLGDLFWLGEGDPRYDYINDIDSSRNFDGGTMYDPYFKYSYMEKDEISNYNYLYHKEGKSSADDYLKYLEPTLNARQQGKVKELSAIFANEAGGWSSIASIPLNLVSGVGLLDAAGQTASKWWTELNTGEYAGPVDYNRPTMTAGNISSTIRGVRADHYNQYGVIKLNEDEHPVLSKILNGKGWGDVYQLGMSMADSVTVGGLSKLGVPGATALLGGSAGTQGMLDALDRGATDEQAVAMGVLNAIFEALFEKVSIDHLINGDTGKIVLDTLIQGGIEASEEGFTTLANNAADILIMAEKSVREQTIAAYMEQGLSREEAYKKALWDEAINLGWDMVGGLLSGGIMGGGSSALNKAGEAIDTFKQNTATGRSIMDTEGAVDSLMMLADDMAGVTTGKDQKNLMRQTEKVSKKMDSGSKSDATARKVAKLYDTVKGSYNTQNHADIVKALTAGESGFSTKEANKIAGALIAHSNGLELTDAQANLLESVKDNPAVLDIVESINSSETLIGQRNNQLREFNQDVTINRMKNIITKQVTEKEFTPEGVYDTSSKGKAIRTDTNEEIDIKGVKDISKGKLVLELADGQTIDAKSVSFASEADALIYEAVAKIGDNINAESANQLIAQFKGGNAMVFARGIAQAYTYGFYGVDKSELFSKYSLADKLTDEQREFAYNLGKEYRPVKDAHDKTENIKKFAKSGKTPSEKGVFYRDKDGNATDIETYLKESNIKLNELQKTGIEAMRKMSKMMGVRFNVFETWVENGKSYYLDENGDVVEGNPNGFYDTTTGEIYIDLNAGNDYQGTMLFTIAHEVTHFMRQWSPEHFTKIAEIVFQHGGMKGSVSELVALKRVKAKAKGKSISYDVAMEELVADGMETILKDGKVVEFMADVKKKDHAAWEKLKGWFKNLAKFLRKMVWAYRNQSAQTTEGAKVAEFSQDLLNQIERIYAEGAVASGENYSRVESIVGQINIFLDEIMELDTVATIDSSNATPYTGDRTADENSGRDVFKAQGGVAIRKGFGRVVLGKRGAVHTVFHGNGPAKQAAFPAIKAVIENGIEICRDNNHDGLGFDTITISAPIKFYGKKAPLAVVVKVFEGVNADKTFYIHEICDAQGNYIQLDEAEFEQKNSSTNFVEPTSTVSAADVENNLNTNIHNDGEIVKSELEESGIGFDEETKTVFALRDSTAYKDILTVGRKKFDTEAISQLVAKGTGRSIEDARKWVNSELTIANLVMANPEFLDFDPDERYDAIKKNSDYPQGTVDLSNLCPKREEFTAMFDMLQKQYPNKLFTAQDIADMRKILSDAKITVACGACFVEDRRQLIGEIADTFIGMWKEAVETGNPLQKTNAAGNKIDLMVTKELAKKYGLTPGTKIMATDAYIPNQYDLTTYEGFKKLEKNHPMIAMSFNRYNNSRGQQSARLIEGRAEYKRQILGWSPAQVRRVNNNGGLRIFSFSDFEVVHLLDLVQVIIDCAAKGVKIQGYTKIPAFAKLVRDTGIKLNRSLIPLGDLGYHVENGKVVLDYDTTEGVDIHDENFLDERDNPNVGNILIGINPTQISAAMLDAFVDYIIPFHSNKAKAILKKLGTGEWVNYKESQHEKDISTGTSSKHNVNIYTEVIDKYHPTNKVEFVEAFLEECKRQGKIPRYSEFLNKEYKEDGTYQDEYGAFDYTYREGFHKLIVDFKMFDKNGNILPQGNITPKLNEGFMKELLNAEIDKKQSYKFPKEVYDAIDKRFGEQTTKMSDRDSAGNQLSKEQQEFFKDSKVRDKKGNLLIVYHGTTANFYTFKKGDVGFHFGTKGAARGRVGYGKNVTIKEVYLNITNPIVFDEDLGSWDADYRLTRELYDRGVLTMDEAMSVLRTDDGRYKRSTESANKKLASVLLEKGYDGIAYQNTFETKKATTSYIAFSSNQAKEVTNTAPTSNPDTRYSDRNNAPTFYSHMAKVVDAVKQEKLGAASVVSMLRGKGVKAEEIKWSGIEEWLAGKKSVTKAELQEFIAGSMLQIEEEALSNEEIPYTEDQQKRLDENTAKRDEIAKRLADEWKRITGDDFPIRNTGAGLESAVVNAIIDANLEQKKASFEGRLLEKLRKDLKEVIENNDDFGFDSWKDALRSIHRHRRDFISHYEMSTGDKAIIVKYCNALNAYNELPNKISDADADKLRDVAKVADIFNRIIGNVKSEHYAENEKHMAKWGQYKLKGGDNYREILFKMPGSSYYNDAMAMHWDERDGVLAHARIQDLNTFLGKMLFIEEIQSDWHNDGHKDGYANEETAVRKRLDDLAKQWDDLLEKSMSGSATESYAINEKMDAVDEEKRRLEDKLRNGRLAPDAPFKDNYHEYVLKRLLREAAENDYDSIGWTTAQTQVERWSEKYAEGYRIEYDQDIPKFLNKYGKKWGTKVGKTTLDNGTEVWSMAITDSMKESVMTEGQPLYSDRVTDQDTLAFLNEQLENGDVTKVYRAMQVQPVDENGNVIKAAVLKVVSYSPLRVEAKTFGKNGKVDVYPAELFSPMAGMVNGKWSKSIALNAWEETTFDLAHATTAIDEKTGKPKIDNDKKNASYGEVAYYYGLVKGGIDDNGKKLTDVPARYNPYIHTSLSALNDQFSSANNRPELVTVECIVPNSELTSGFRAEGAKDRVGAMSWHSGPTSSRLAKVGKARTVILTRYDMPIRVVPDSEVAKAVAEYIGDTENIAIKGSTVTPSLSRELMNLGISVLNEEQWAKYDKEFPTKTFGKKKKSTTRYSDRVLMGSLFSGGGTLEAGLAYQMLDKQFGVEYDGRIASVYADNHGDHIQVGKVEDFDISKYDDIFYLHASPVCHNFSKAKHGATELQMDINSAKATARHLEKAMPQVFTVENAPGYRKSESLKIITDKLTELGYKWDVDVYNSADYGSATSRNRVILRAVKDGELPAKPAKQERSNSWDKVTRDLWDTLPKATLRPSFISAIENTRNLPILDADGKVNVNKPLLILTTTSGHTVTYCWEGDICPTLTTKCGEARLVMPDGNIYAVTPEFMGRIQGLPDDYKYPKEKTRAFTIIGNGIPTHLTNAVVGGVLDSAYEQTHDGNVLYQDRTEDSVSNRSLLANAFEGIAKPEEQQKVKEYKEKVSLIDAEEKKLRELNEQIKELSFSKGPRDTKKIRDLRDEATMTANRINTLDKILLRLEAAQPLQDVLAREKKRAYDKAAMEGRKALNAYKEKTAKTQRELLNKWKDSRKRAVESHEKTVMRNKIRSVVGELNELLLNEDKKRHVPDSLKKAVAEALALVNMDTVKAEERAAKYAALIAKETDPDKIDAYTATMENILRQGEKMGQKLKELRDAYEEIQNSDDPDIANGYDPMISGAIKELAESIGNTSLKDMSIEQLSDVYDMYKMVLTRVRDANKSLIESIKESIANRASRVVGEVRRAGGEHKYRAAILDPIRAFFWNNAKPVYAMEHIGSEAMTEAYNQVRKGEDTWAKDVTEARAYYIDKSKKYGYDSWDFDAKYTFESASGLEFELTLEQILSLYAYSKREQSHDHLRLGGFVFDSNIETYKDKGSKLLKYKVNTADAHQLTPEILANITGKLTQDQMAFVDEMQDYLSTVMGAKGNEVTMKMYGVKLFKEKFYFPLKSARQFMFEQNEVSGEVRIKNSGFTNKVVAKANNPVILSNFMDVWANHVNDMSMYHSFVLPLEDFNRIFNYNSPKQEGKPPVSVKGTIQSAYSPAAVNYIKQLITDLNGGAMSDPRETVAKSMMAKFKKAKVFSSLSVVIQQPSAIGRAFALVDPKYFHPTVDGMNHDELWAELKQYAPVAIIKEMGYFDTNMGKSTLDFIKAKEYSTLKEKAKAIFTDADYRDELLSKAPALADELTWCAIWNAVKRETLAKHPGLDIKSEPFLMLAGARFTEVITKTQVYDSVLARSANMRSKSGLMSMVTSFMAEPTTTINMLEDALRKGKRGYKGYAAKAFASVAVSVILNNALVALVYGMRDDDEDETFAEKYMQAFVSGMMDDINPLTYLPYLKDMWSLLQGYDVERSDMSLVSDFADSVKGLVKAYTTEDGDIAEAWWTMAGAVANIGGVPMQNIRRDVNGAINFFNTIIEDVNGRATTWGSMGDALETAVRDSLPVVGWLNGEAKADKLYDAIISGDTAYVNRLKGSYKTEDAYHNAVRKALRENDPRILEAAKAQFNGDPSERVRIQKLIIADGFAQDDVVAATNTEINKLKPDEGSSGTKAKGFYTVEDFAREIANGDQASANAVKVDVIQTLQKNGKTAEEAEKSFRSSAKSELKELYLAGKISKDKTISALTTYCGIERDDAESDIQYWDFKQDYPDVFADDAWIDEYYEEVKSSGISLRVFIDYRNKVKGITGDNKKEGRMAVINSLPITSAQKDALYYAEGWAASKLYEAPWH